MTERVFVVPPGSQLGPITPAQRQALLQGSLVAGVYEKAIDAESAYEVLTERNRTAQAESAKTSADSAANSGGLLGGLSDVLFGSTGPRGAKRDGMVQSVIKSEARLMGRQLLRGALGTLFGSKKR